jgi:hypothetical protein
MFIHPIATSAINIPMVSQSNRILLLDTAISD